MKHFNKIKTKTYEFKEISDDESDRYGQKFSDKIKSVMHVTESELKIIRK